MTSNLTTDICIIGAGSGGLSLAAGAAQMGAKVVLIEGGKMGGDCLNYGCIPSKSLIAAAKSAHNMRDSAKFGITPVVPNVDYAATKDYVQSIIETIAPVDSQERFEGFGIKVIREYAHFSNPHEVVAGTYRIKARRFVIATGSHPFVPPISGIENVTYYTNETIFTLREKPEHLIIIGAGPIGLELGQAHVRLGSKVTVLSSGEALNRDDPELKDVVLQNMRAEGLVINEHIKITNVSQEDDGVQVVSADGTTFNGSHLLIAAGRKAVIDRLNLDAAGVEYDSRGVKVDQSLRSKNRKVYAVGDAAGGLQFTHAAGYHAGIVIRQIVLGLPAKTSNNHIPWATYTDPELAHVGLSEADALKIHGDKLTVIRQHFNHNDRAITEGKAKGLIKVMVVKGRPVGASIVGPNAGELIAMWALAISSKLKMSNIAGMVAAYPTLGEISKRAAGAYFSPALFENSKLKAFVRFVQKFIL